MVYRVYVADGHEEMVRGGHIEGLQLRALRNITAIGDDETRVPVHAESAGRICRHGAGRFWRGARRHSQHGGDCRRFVLDEIEVRGFHGEPRRLPLVEAPPLK